MAGSLSLHLLIYLSSIIIINRRSLTIIIFVDVSLTTIISIHSQEPSSECGDYSVPYVFHPQVVGVSTMPAAIAGVNEVQGKNIRYSRFSDAGKTTPEAPVLSKVGTMAIYSLAVVTALVATIKFPKAVIVPASC